MNARVVVRGIGAEGRHGANPGETDRAQPFVVDLEVDVAPERDDVDATADYRAIAEAARLVIEGESHQLLETLADAVARAVADLPAVARVRAVVHKPRAAEELAADDVSAEAVVG